MNNLANLLNNYLKSNKRDSLNAYIAKYMLANLDRLFEIKVADIAEACHTSKPSIIRFCRELGFEDFSNFKNVIKAESNLHKKESLNSEDVFLVKPEIVCLESINEWANMVGDSISNALMKINKEKVESLARDIMAYRHVYCIGNAMSGMFGDYLNMRLSFQQKALVSMNVPDLKEVLSDDPRRTLVILVSQNGIMVRENKKLLSYLKKYCDKIWLVTQLPQYRVNESFVENVLYIENCENYQASCHVLLSIAEFVGQHCMKYYQEYKN